MKNTPKFNHRQVWRLAWPTIIANISTPLLGLVDTAVMGHLDSPKYLGAVALGSLIFGFIYWGFGFLRMGTTGLVAQASGQDNNNEIKAVLARALVLAMIISIVLLLLNQSLRTLSFWLIHAEQPLEHLAEDYFAIRILSAPATLSLYVLSGWFLGLQNVKYPLVIVLTTNTVNILLDLLFVVHLKMDVEGVAWATVLAEYTGLVVGWMLLAQKLKRQAGGFLRQDVFHVRAMHEMLTINTHIFIRTLCLIFAFAFFTEQSARYGEIILAANTVLLNFQTFMAYALDGFAHAAEALVGKAKGAKDRVLLKNSIRTAACWSVFVATGFSFVYLISGDKIVDMLTGLSEVRASAHQYLIWVTILPVLSVTCFLLDGVFIGLTLTRAMRNTMIFSLCGVFIPAWYLSLPLGNQGLWLALMLFMVARSISMSWVFLKFMQRNPII